MPARRAATVGKRYEIQSELGRGGMGAVYRVRDRLRGQHVALKRVIIATAKESSPDPNEAAPALVAPTVADIAGLPTMLPSSEPARKATVVVLERGRMSRDRLQALRFALANEFRLLATLRHPNIVSVLDYGFAPDGQPYFTMELLQDSQPLTAASEGCSLQVRAGLLLQILQALSYLHRRGVLHRDLKPANVRCVATAMGPRVKLLDFGLALLYEKPVSDQAEIAGTVGYIAPEVLQGEAITPRADLYAFGVMAFELLTGRSPFFGESLTTLVAATLSSEPVIADDELPTPVSQVLSRLLARDPQARYTSAEEAAAALADAVGIPQPAESEELRNCVLGSAALVGREPELAALRSALRDLRTGHGQLILLAGESGIGKSRLVEELRALALVDGVAVVSAQGRGDGAADLGLFADALRTICMETPPPPLARSVLKGIAPDLPQLLDDDIPDPPAIDAQAARQRLMTTIEETLRSIVQPTIFLVEDLHWAGPDSIAVLRQLSARLDGTPLLVVGSYRSDERHGLPGELPRATVLPLGRLRREDIARLSASILGDVRASDRLLDWLTAESEGNSFFITEVMRAVAEEAGSIDAVGAAALPQGMLTGGMDAVLRRRLAQAPVWAQPLLRLSAIGGRQLAVDALRTCAPDLDDWLRVCAAAGVLEVHQTSWRFSHDKLRERLLADIPADDRAALHRKFASALETAHPDTGEVAATLAYHWERGQDLPKAAAYAAIAGEAAARRGALSEALALLKQARALQDQLAVPATEKVHTQRQLAETHYGLSQHEAGAAAVREAFELLGQPLPVGKATLGRAQLQLLAQLISARVWPQLPHATTTAAAVQQTWEEVWLHGLNIEMNGFLGQMGQVLFSSLRLAHLGDLHPDLGSQYAFSLPATFIMSMLPLPVQPALPSALDALLQALPAIPLDKSQILALRTLGAIHHYRGDQQQAMALLQRALTAADQLHDSTTQRMVLSYLQRAALYRGDYATALHSTERLAALAQTLGDDLWRHFANLMSVSLAIHRDDTQAAMSHAEKSAAGAPAHQHHYVSSVRAIAHARLGQYPEAARFLLEGLTGFERLPINTLFGVETYTGPVETALYLADHGAATLQRRTTDELITRALRILERYAAQSAHGWAPLCLPRGRLAWRAGHRQRAAWYFRAARRLADRCGMATTAARALAWQGRAAADASMMREALSLLRAYSAHAEASAIEGWLTGATRV